MQYKVHITLLQAQHVVASRENKDASPTQIIISLVNREENRSPNVHQGLFVEVNVALFYQAIIRVYNSFVRLSPYYNALN